MAQTGVFLCMQALRLTGKEPVEATCDALVTMQDNESSTSGKRSLSEQHVGPMRSEWLVDPNSGRSAAAAAQPLKRQFAGPSLNKN